MNAIVRDASALIAAMPGTDGESVALRRRIAAADYHAPHLIDAEPGSVPAVDDPARPAGARAGQHPFPRIAPSGHAPHDHGGSLADAADHRRRAARIGTAPAVHTEVVG